MGKDPPKEKGRNEIKYEGEVKGKQGKVMIKLIQVACKRCGRPILTAEKAIHGDSNLKTRLGNICSNCITPEEKRQVEDGIAMAIHRNRWGGK